MSLLKSYCFFSNRHHIHLLETFTFRERGMGIGRAYLPCDLDHLYKFLFPKPKELSDEIYSEKQLKDIKILLTL